MSDLAAAIDRRIVEFLESVDPRDGWLKPVVRRWTFLPLYRGWVSMLGIRPGGTIVRWDSEDDPDNIHVESGSYWLRFAIVQGTKTYPELVGLQPVRPPDAVMCEFCRGTGEFPGLKVICQCGGSGWCIPGELREPAVG